MTPAGAQAPLAVSPSQVQEFHPNQRRGSNSPPSYFQALVETGPEETALGGEWSGCGWTPRAERASLSPSVMLQFGCGLPGPAPKDTVKRGDNGKDMTNSQAGHDVFRLTVPFPSHVEPHELQSWAWNEMTTSFL